MINSKEKMMKTTTARNAPIQSAAVDHQIAAAENEGMVSQDATALATIPSAAVATTDLMSEMMADAGDGSKFEAGQVAVPFLSILQDNSPQVKEQDSRYINGARAGMILNTVSGKIFDNRIFPGRSEAVPGLQIVLAAFTELQVEWVDRDNGGGFVAQHLPTSDFVAKCVPHPVKTRELMDPSTKNIVVLTHYHYPIIAEDPSNPSWAVIGMSSSQLKKSRKMNSFISEAKIETPAGKFKPPVYALVFELRTIPEKNSKDQSWWGWDIKYVGPVTEVFAPADAAIVYAAAKKYREAVVRGIAKATPPSDDAPGVEDKEVPF